MRLHIKLRFRLVYMDEVYIFFFMPSILYTRDINLTAIHCNTMILFIMRNRYNFREFNIRCYRYAAINIMDRQTQCMYLGSLVAVQSSQKKNIYIYRNHFCAITVLIITVYNYQVIKYLYNYISAFYRVFLLERKKHFFFLNTLRNILYTLRLNNNVNSTCIPCVPIPEKI